MKRYSPNQHVPMKFHNLYVWLLNPLGILVLGGLAAIALCALLGVPALPALQDRLDGDGSEAARLMLALKGILSAADRVPTLIFDEIDAGIGGRVGAVVGEKLWGLTRAGKPGGGATSRFGRAATAAEGIHQGDLRQVGGPLIVGHGSQG